MKKIISIVLTVLLLVTILLVSGCTGLESIKYDNADKYQIGDAQIKEKVEKIDIDWLCGSINLKASDKSRIELKEEYKENIKDDYKMHWFLDGTTLRVKFGASGKLRLFGETNKTLTVSVPKNIKYSNIKISASSANINVENVKANAIDISTTSGDESTIVEADTINMSSTSGLISCQQIGTSSSVVLDSTSGDIDSKVENCNSAKLDSLSGNLSIEGKIEESLVCDSTSGIITTNLDKTPKNVDLDSTFGEVKMTLPKNGDFTLYVDTASGDLSSNFALKKDDDKYICGKGTAQIYIDTTSGDVTVNEK